MSADRAERERFLREWGCALHSHGVPAHRLEGALDELAKTLEVEGQFLSTPTSLMCAFGPMGDQRVSLARLVPGSTDLGRLATLDELGQAVLAGQIDAAEGVRRLEAALAAPRPFGLLAATLAYSGASAAAAVFLGGRPVDVLGSAITGLAVGVLAALGRDPDQMRLLTPVGGLVAATGAALSAHYGAASLVVTLAGVLVLLPGLSLTVAMTELATGNLVSGTSRLSGALATLFQLAFGAALGRYAADLLPRPLHPAHVALPAWADPLALAGMVVTLVVLLQARWRDAGWLALGIAVGRFGSQAASALVSPDLAPFVGALAIMVVANLTARVARRPSTLVAVPGLLVLVPGSLGLRGITAMFDDALRGLELLFQTGMVAVGLVAGVLIANVLVRPRRSL